MENRMTDEEKEEQEFEVKEEERAAAARVLAVKLAAWAAKMDLLERPMRETEVPGLAKACGDLIDSKLMPLSMRKAFTKIIREVEYAKLQVLLGSVAFLAGNCEDDVEDAAQQIFKAAGELTKFASIMSLSSRSRGMAPSSEEVH